MPEVSPKITRLVHSAIHGDVASLDELRSAVSNDVSRSVVDSLLAIMGGVDAFDESSGGAGGEIWMDSEKEGFFLLEYRDSGEGEISRINDI
ncbi:uncharacterized protein A4U43_C07F14190 [Asparagus officinalis]|uniref:Uncharacterized protein n=1 Tax=Asparagus officinalis TaxID=4686 RepID=A0A5P1EBU3_ASPOF|nr:uncharacterized protein A4U43_C07F14190 [Asparagus officinalis]